MDNAAVESNYSFDSDAATDGSTAFVMPRPPPPITPGPLEIYQVQRATDEGTIPLSDEPLLVARFRTVPTKVRIGTPQQIRLLVYALRSGQDMDEIPRRPCINGLPQYRDDDPRFQPRVDILGRSISSTDHVPAISLWSGIWENLALDADGNQPPLQGEGIKQAARDYEE